LNREYNGTEEEFVVPVSIGLDYEDVDLEPEVSYKYKVKCVDGRVESAYSNILTITTLKELIPAPTNLSNRVSYRWVYLKWEYSVPNITFCIIDKDDGSGY